MTVDDAIGGVLSILLIVFLLVALLMPERF